MQGISHNIKKAWLKTALCAKKTFRTAGPKRGHNEYFQIYWTAKPQVWVGSLHRPLEPAESPLQTVQWPRINLVFGAGARGSALHPRRERVGSDSETQKPTESETVASAPLKEGIKTWCRCHCCTRARLCSTSGLSITSHQDRNSGQKLNKQKTWLWQQESFESQRSSVDSIRWNRGVMFAELICAVTFVFLFQKKTHSCKCWIDSVCSLFHQPTVLVLCR